MTLKLHPTRIRGFKMRNMYLLMLCFGMMFGSGYVYSQGGIAKTAKQTLEIGKRYKLKIEPSPELFPKYGLGGKNTVYNDFRIVTSEDGSLTLSFEMFAEETQIVLYNESGISLEPASNDVTSGNSRWNNISRAGVIELKWNTTTEKFIGSFTWKLDADTYYLRIVRSQKGLSTANISLGLRDLDGNPVVDRPIEQVIPSK